MKSMLTGLLLLGLGFAAGMFGYPFIMMVSENGADAESNDAEVDYWVAPMDPNYRRDKPGKSMMGMDLVPVYKDTGNAEDPEAVRIKPSVMHNLGVRTSRVTTGTIAKQIRTVGYVGYDESKINHVHVRTNGWIEKLHVKSEGETVQRGQVLFELYAPDVVNAQEEYLQVINSKIKGMQRPARTRLRALGMSDRQIKQLTKRGKSYQRIRVYAPRSGTIAELNVGEGMFVKPDMTVMTIADLSSIWLMVEVFERQANWVAKGQKVDANFAYLPGTQWQGKVDYIYPNVDPMTRTFKLRLRFANPGGALKPNMYGKVTLYTQAKQNALSVPREALIRSGQKNHVILKTSSGSFKQQPVTIGIESGDQMEILSGLQAGDTVVTSAQFLIDSEASLKASFSRMAQMDGADRAMPGSSVMAQYQGTGIIEGIKPKQHLLTLTHDPIDALGWPKMAMDFAVDPSLSLQRCLQGAKVHFTLDKHNENTFVITKLKMMGITR